MGWLLMVSPIFNLLDCEILPKRKEIFDKYCKIIRWGRANPTRFIEDFFKLQLTDMQKYVLMSSWIPANIVWLMGRNSRKAMSLDTPVYYRTTDRGEKIEKKTIGDLKVGDVIYDESGNLTEVIHLNPIVIENEYVVEFEDGEKISCNSEHLWKVFDSCDNKWKTLETGAILKKMGQESRFFVPKVKEGKKKINAIRKTGNKIAMRCITVDNPSGLFLCGNNYTVTHNSYLVTPFMMARALLLPNTNTYIMAPSGGQAQGTFTKLEDLAKGNIASVIGVSSVFLDECVRMNSTADPFTHAKQSYSVELYNGSTINTLNSVIKNIVGIRQKICRSKMKRVLFYRRLDFAPPKGET